MNNNLMSRDVKCFLCNDLSGIIIKVRTKLGGWVHPTCVNWIKDIYFEEEKDTDNNQLSDWTSGCTGRIVGGPLPHVYFKTTCVFCNVVGGACIKCDYKGCNRRFHVRCGIYEGVIRETTEMNKDPNPKEENNIQVFCDQHDFLK